MGFNLAFMISDNNFAAIPDFDKTDEDSDLYCIKEPI